MIIVNNSLEVRRLSLSQQDIHVWLAYLPTIVDKQTYWQSILSSNELERANKFKFLRDRNQFVAGRGILRCLLSYYLGQCPQSIEIVYGPYGKPSLLGEASLHFNLSHSKACVLYAFSLNYKVGVDIEYIEQDLGTNQIAAQLLSIQDQKKFQMLSTEERVNAFFKMWVCQEAFLKATGKGWISNDNLLLMYNQAFMEEEAQDSAIEKRTPLLYYFECIPGYASALYREESAKIHHYFYEDFCKYI